MKKELLKPQFSSTTLVQEIVNILKQPPFNDTMTLMSFNEKKQFELLELITKILEMIDDDLKLGVNDNENTILKKILDFLTIVNFPYSSGKQLEDDLAQADKKLLIQIIHFSLTKLNELKKKYYLSKYLNNIKVPDELTGDEEIINLLNQFKDLQYEFQASYELVEEKRTQKPNLKDLKNEINKLSSDKIQLNVNINNFKKSYSNKPDFKTLFESTSRLRKEQEEDSNLEKQVSRLQYELEEVENKLLLSRQKLIDSKNNLKENVSANNLLENLRTERDKNRDISDNLANIEILDKRNKLKALEEILIMPEITYDILNNTRNEKKKLESDIERLEIKLKSSPKQSSELEIYLNNVKIASENKERSSKMLDKLEKDKQILEQKLQELEKKFENNNGYRYVRKGELIQQIENIKEKKETYSKFNKQLEALKGEGLLLDRTISLLKPKVDDFEEIVSKVEEKYGSFVLNSTKKELEDLTRKKKDTDANKVLTLEEYSKLVFDLKKKIDSTQSLYAPLIDQKEGLQKELDNLQPEYQRKKNAYDSSMTDTLKEYNKIKENYSSLEAEYNKYQNDYFNFNTKLKIIENQIKRYESENGFLKDKDKRLNEKYKSFTDYYVELLNVHSKYIERLTVEKNSVRDTAQDNYRQLKFFNDMKSLLLAKKQTFS